MSSSPEVFTFSVDPGFSTPTMAAIFSPSGRIAGMLAFEAALASAQARLGVIPASAAEAIQHACAAGIADSSALLAEGWQVGTPVVPMLEMLRARLPESHHAHIHHGATSQDVLDTATALQVRGACRHLHGEIVSLAERMQDIARTHRSTPAMARTLMQHAEVTSFGWTVARWLAPMISAGRALALASAQLPVQLGSATGALAPFAMKGQALLSALAEQLDLRDPKVPWHGDRTPLLRATHALADLCLALRKAAGDLVLLAQSEVAEVRMRGGASSAMPHKQNPIDATRAIAAANASLHATSALVTAPAHELERACGGWQQEWLFIPLSFNTAAAALSATRAAFATLVVDEERLRATSSCAADGSEAPVSTQPLIDHVLADAALFCSQPFAPTGTE